MYYFKKKAKDNQLYDVQICMYLAENGGKRQRLRRKVFVDADGPGPATTTAGQPGLIVGRA